MTEHTPTPRREDPADEILRELFCGKWRKREWRAEKHATLNSYQIVGKSQHPDGLSELVAFGIERPDDADLIVRAVNSHETLLEAAKALCAILREWNVDDEIANAYYNLEGAIRKAETE
jgi:hypothetical protein